MNKTLQCIGTFLICFVFFGISALCWFTPDHEISMSERRKLAEMPKITAETVKNTSFMQDFDLYTLDQFPLREKFRTIKAMAAFGLFRQKENNGIYVVDGQAAQLEYPLNQDSMDFAAKKITDIYNLYLSESEANIYFSIVPDKGFYLAQSNGYPAMDYAQMIQYFQNHLDFATHIDITDTLSGSNYYATDSHWKQETLLTTAKSLSQAMGNTLTAEYETKTVTTPFYGVYYGYAALPLPPDEIKYLTNNELEACTVYNVETGKTTGIYDMEKLSDKDPYEMFLSGAAPLLYLENPNSNTGKELILFRDSYGSSIAPLLVESYDKITLVDTRYVVPHFLHNFVDFSTADDVLFLYSTSLLNNSRILK